MEVNDIKVAVVAIARLENDYINEWIEHNLNIGVDRIFIYDNSSSNEEKLNGAVKEKYLRQVKIIPAYNKQKYQMPAYKDAYMKYNKYYTYMIFIDIDEFIMLQKDENIKQFLHRLPDDCECYRMNWQIYGDSGIINRDVSSSVVEDFTIPVNKRNATTKSIVKCGLSNIDFESVHYAIHKINGAKRNLVTYYGNMKEITGKLPIDKKSISIHTYDYTFIKLNHYMTKSICEFISQKMRRPDAAWNYVRNIDKDFFQYNEKTKEKMEVYELSKKIIKYYYWSPRNNKFENAGDYYNKVLINKLYYCSCNPVNFSIDTDIALCGSVLTNESVKNVKYILGCGLQNNMSPKNTNPKSYFAVRGRMTKERLISKGIKIGDVKFVDPGLLVSKLYDLGEVDKKYKIGIIPHYVDEENVRKKYGGKYNIISMKTCDVQMVCKQISECDIIVSSSLHGIIFSHALGVPAYHIEMKKLQAGDNFKFKDYYSSYDNVQYKTFKCNDFVIPFEDILLYDSENRSISNPTIEEIGIKQNELLSILPYKRLISKKFLRSYNPVICFTTYKGRINYIKPFIDSVLNQTIKCDVYMTLSSDEFPMKEKELPEFITDITDQRFHINWVKENIKPFKKSLYTLDLIDDDSVIITLDDDFALDDDTIERGLRYFDGNNPLTIKNHIRSVGYNKKMYTPSGCFTIYSKDMVKNWKKVLTDEIIATNDDDSFMLAMFWLNGYKNRPIPIDFKFNTDIITSGGNSITRSKTNDEFREFAINTDTLISNRVIEITKKSLYNSFGYFHKKEVLPSNNVENGDVNNHTNTREKKNIREKVNTREKKQTTVSKLREDILNGNVIKVSFGNGYIWKRVR